MAPKTTAQAFKTARIRAGLSVAELAEVSGVYAQTLHRIEAGQHATPQMATARAVAEATGVEVGELYVLDDAEVAA